MRIIWVHPLLICLTLTTCSTSKAAVDVDGFEHVPLIKHEDLEVSLLLRPVATPADHEFIGFLINNKTGGPIHLADTSSYRIDGLKRLDRVTLALVSTSSLARGNSYDLLYRDVIDINADRSLLPEGESRRMGYSSGYSLALLGIPPKESKGFTIKATVHLQVGHAGKILSTPPAGIPIQFDWLPSDEAGINDMKQRLSDVLRGGDPGHRQYFVMSTLLDHAAIGSTMTTADLIVGLHSWEQRGGKILQYLDEHRNQNDGLVNYALTLIEKRDYLRMLVLRSSKSLHDVRLVDPLTEWASGRPNFKGSEFALELLSRQLDLAPDRDALTAELGRVWLARSPITQAGKINRKDPWRWSYEVELLSLTRDRNLIPRLIPYLDQKEIVVDSRKMAAFNNGISTRACDVAYNAILDLLERKDERLTLHTGVRRLDPDVEYARRNALIVRLKTEVASRR